MTDINKTICNYIASQWIAKARSKRSFAAQHNVDEKTVRKIAKKEGYNVPIKTLYTICEARGMSLSSFFKLLDR